MNPKDRNTEIGIVVEVYNHTPENCVLVVRSRDERKFHFFYIPTNPEVSFGDFIEMNFDIEEIYVYRGNSRLTFKTNAQEFPGSLLMELITERMNLWETEK
jgi:hypothetical protein